MPEARPRLGLASTSPRRRELLEQIGIRYRVLRIAVDESVREGESPLRYVRRLAAAKAIAGFEAAGGALPVLGADTAVILDGEVLGKPEDRAHAECLLGRLSGRRHEVLSAVSLVNGATRRGAVSRSVVSFRVIEPWEIRAYVATGEPMDKAGGYAVQGRAAVFVHRLQGSYSGVMGLPLYETATLLAAAGVDVLARA